MPTGYTIDEIRAKDAEIASLKAALAEAKSALHDVCLECKDWEYNYGRLCKSYAKITGELAEYKGRVEAIKAYLEWSAMPSSCKERIKQILVVEL